MSANIYGRGSNVLVATANSISRWGIKFTLWAIWSRLTKWFLDPVIYGLHYSNNSSKHFIFCNSSYNYFYYPHNSTWKNERCVELPIVYKFIENESVEDVLEVGNVLSHYFNCHHQVVDKYEEGSNVVNVDIVDFQPSKKYKLIVSISTFEHIGFDEQIKDPAKIFKCVDKLTSLLLPGGKLVYTVPLGLNPHLDSSLIEGYIPGDKHFLKRTSYEVWEETDKISVKGVAYNEPHPYANAIVVGIIRCCLYR